MTRLLADMSGEELAEVLREMADRVQEGIDLNKSVIEKLQQYAEEMEAKRKGEGGNA